MGNKTGGTMHKEMAETHSHQILLWMDVHMNENEFHQGLGGGVQSRAGGRNTNTCHCKCVCIKYILPIQCQLCLAKESTPTPLKHCITTIMLPTSHSIESNPHGSKFHTDLGSSGGGGSVELVSQHLLLLLPAGKEMQRREWVGGSPTLSLYLSVCLYSSSTTTASAAAATWVGKLTPSPPLAMCFSYGWMASTWNSWNCMHKCVHKWTKILTQQLQPPQEGKRARGAQMATGHAIHCWPGWLIDWWPCVWHLFAVCALLKVGNN